jgi:hypothetical protein
MLMLCLYVVCMCTQVKRWWHDALSKIWRVKRKVEDTIEDTLESIGLIADFEAAG